MEKSLTLVDTHAPSEHFQSVYGSQIVAAEIEDLQESKRFDVYNIQELVGHAQVTNARQIAVERNKETEADE